jgi:hypothetical protein
MRIPNPNLNTNLIPNPKSFSKFLVIQIEYLKSKRKLNRKI